MEKLNYNCDINIVIWYNDHIKWVLIIDELLLSTNWLVNINYEIINVDPILH